MSDFNQVTLSGNLTRDPELRYTPKGTAICEAGIAVNRQWKSETGETQEEVSFFDLKLFGRTGEAFCQHLKKGRKALVTGRLKQESWDDRQTSQKRYKIVVNVESWHFMDSGNRAAGVGAAEQPGGRHGQSGPGAGDDKPPF